MRQYRVEADRITGEWLSEPILEGYVDAVTWYAQEDTDNEHYETFVRHHPDPRGIHADCEEVCAVIVRWVWPDRVQ